MNADSIQLSRPIQRSAEGIPAGYARLRRGSCVDIGIWAEAHVEGRIRLRAEAAEQTALYPPIWASTTAAAFHVLPLLGVRDSHLHTIERAANPQKTRTDIVRHNVPLAPHDITQIGGHLVTSLERTAYDAARMLSLEGAVALMDAAMRIHAWDESTRTYSIERAEEFRAGMIQRIRANTGARGIKQLRFVVEFADGRSESPGESQSRVRMWELHIPAPVLQMPIAIGGEHRRADFAWPQLHRFGEFDGAIKLTDPAMMRGRTVEEILRDQRERREAIEAATGWPVLHWGHAESKDAESFLASLTRQGWPAYARL